MFTNVLKGLWGGGETPLQMFFICYELGMLIILANRNLPNPN